MARVFVFNPYKWYQKYIKSDNTRLGEFHRTFKKIGEDCVWFHDPNNAWYQQEYWPAKIQQEIDTHGRPDLVLGCSMGGWAALYFQPLIRAKKVLAFSPQMTTDPELLAAWGQKNWALNCKNFLGDRKSMPESDGLSEVYYGSKCDKQHQKIAHKLGYSITIAGDGHNSASYLSDHDKLIPLIQSCLS